MHEDVAGRAVQPKVRKCMDPLKENFLQTTLPMSTYAIFNVT